MEAWNYANLWESVAAAAPDRPALIQGPRVVSYRDFDRRANALARRMLEAGVSHQSKVGAYLYNAPEYLESYFAAFKAGLAPFNINYHFEHHANFSVPWYSLPAYHKKAREIVPEALRPYYFHNQYLMQLAGQKPLPPANLRPLMGEGPEVGAPKREEDYEAEDALGGVPVTV